MKCFHLNRILLCLMPFVLASCATQAPGPGHGQPVRQLAWNPDSDFYSRLPQHIDTKGEKVIVVDPNVHAWGAYSSNGTLVRAGIASSGASWCEDVGRPCYTSVGTFRISSLGSVDCKSSIYPKPNGGGLMPYCMFFHGDMSLHGSPDHLLAEGNISHGCVRMRIQDSEWVRNYFAKVGTKVIVKPYA